MGERELLERMGYPLASDDTEYNGMVVMCNYRDIGKEKSIGPFVVLKDENLIILNSGNFATRRIKDDGTSTDTIVLTKEKITAEKLGNDHWFIGRDID